MRVRKPEKKPMLRFLILWRVKELYISSCKNLKYERLHNVFCPTKVGQLKTS